jgi:hypothetical protein
LNLNWDLCSSFPVTIDDQQEKIIVGVRENLAQWQYNVVPHSAHNALTLTAVLGKYACRQHQ